LFVSLICRCRKVQKQSFEGDKQTRMNQTTKAALKIFQPTLKVRFRWWMPGILVSTIAIAAGLFLYATHDSASAAWFEVGSPGWWVLTTVLHLPFLGILFFLIIGISERLGFYWKGRALEQPGKMPAVRPTVCVQLPMFNEYAVARRVIEAAANMHWPADSFSLQVLDDSTDKDTRRLVEQVSAEVRARGRDCRVLHRTDRHGYKAGALEAGRLQTEADFLVIFDADFVPPADFLLRTIPHFYQLDGQPDTGLALVQAQWGHLNHNESALTLSQSLWVDDHHTLQMAWRSAAWKFVNFTGTAGVWRASAIEAAGGWRAASLVEDGELSFRILFAGYRTKFVKEVVVPAELPTTYTAYKAQQKRWTQGWVQVQRLHLRTLLFGYSAPWLRRLQLFYLMCISWQWPLWTIWILVLPFAILTGLWLGALNPALGVAIYLIPSASWLTLSAAITALETKHTYAEPLTLTSFLGRFGRMFPLAALGTGMLAHQVNAFAEGLFGPLYSEFERTPKAASVIRRDMHLNTPAADCTSVARKTDHVKVHWPYVLSELFFVTYQLTWAVLFAISGLFWSALTATLVACCVIYLAFFYGDHAGKVCFVIEQDKLLSLAQGVWRNTLERNQFYTRILGAVAFLLVLLSIGGQFSKFMLGHAFLKGLVPLFYVDVEQNIPTYFSVFLILFAALLLAVIAILNGKERIPHVSKWVILSFGFLFMAFDEAFQFHERLNILVGRLLGDGTLGVFYFPWIIPGIALVFVLGLFFLRFLLDLPTTTRFRFLMAATFYIGGAIGVELIGSRHAELRGYENWTYSMIATIEESLEMAGLIVFIGALLNYCAHNYKKVRFRFGAQQVAAPDRYSAGAS
jgi:cellulose synthase/poly-beta-1,6-N-acetylglucosamine synthase-like glycosyltransferase